MKEREAEEEEEEEEEGKRRRRRGSRGRRTRIRENYLEDASSASSVRSHLGSWPRTQYTGENC